MNDTPPSDRFSHPPQRIVSLVPSLTESLFDLGLGDRLLGVTDYCIYPAEALSGLPRVGGTKNPRLADILALQPDLVLANREENTRQTVEALQAAGISVWVSFPLTVRQSMEVLWELSRLFQSQAAVLRLRALEMSLDWASSAAAQFDPVRYFCPIWYDRTQDGRPWWMTFNRHTYPHDLLSLFGGENIFANRERNYPLAADLGKEQPQDPGERDTRYPRVTLEEVRQAQPEIILLPNEPFAFEQSHHLELCELLSDTPAVRNERVHLVDGSLISWHGTRLAQALNELPALFSG